MVGGSTYTAGRSMRPQVARQGPQPGWIAELEGLRKALTQDEFESARRHLLAG